LVLRPAGDVLRPDPADADLALRPAVAVFALPAVAFLALPVEAVFVSPAEAVGRPADDAVLAPAVRSCPVFRVSPEASPRDRVSQATPAAVSATGHSTTPATPSTPAPV
jgi:hypothetical protein